MKRLIDIGLGLALAATLLAAWLAYQDHVTLTRLCARAGQACAPFAADAKPEAAK